MTGSSTPDLIENHKILNDMVHEMDKTRLTTMACVSMCDMHDPMYRFPMWFPTTIISDGTAEMFL